MPNLRSKSPAPSWAIWAYLAFVSRENCSATRKTAAWRLRPPSGTHAGTVRCRGALCRSLACPRDETDDPGSYAANPSFARSAATSAISKRSKPLVLRRCRSCRTRRFTPTPIFWSTIWARVSRTGGQISRQARANGAQRLCGVSVWLRASPNTPPFSTTAAPAASWKPCYGTAAKRHRAGSGERARNRTGRHCCGLSSRFRPWAELG